MKSLFRPMLLAVMVGVMATPALLAQDSTEQKSKKQEQEKKEEKKQELPKYELAENATLADAEETLNEIKRFRPASRENMRKHSQNIRSSMPKLYKQILVLAEKEKSTDSPIYFEAKRFDLRREINKLRSRKPTKKPVEQLTKYLDGLKEIEPADAGLAVTAAYLLSRSGFKKEYKEKNYDSWITMFKKTNNQELNPVVARIEGFKLRGNLSGKPIELTGTTYDGKKFDLKDLKGKVVLVDFWATWCGPCIREHPNIEKNYKKYRDKGFEVVGVSIDRNRRALDKFLESKPAKWIVLHDKNGRNPATIKYGVYGIPSMFLIDRQGNVISTNARGKILTKMLAEIFEDADTEDGDSERDGK